MEVIAGVGKIHRRNYQFIAVENKKRIPGQWDAGLHGAENKPGFYGRKPGVNAYGYFYGDKPSGANWRFNRKEDFAESVAMYCGWGRDNPLSKTAHGRIERYLLPNGTKDPIYGIADNWSDYARYFYPEGGDYAKTKRWKFVDELVGRLTAASKIQRISESQAQTKIIGENIYDCHSRIPD